MDERTRRAALRDVAYHRAVLCRKPLYPPQVEAIRLVERHIAAGSGKVLTIRSARQTMKNECSAILAARCLEIFRRRGGVYVRAAPTWRPQLTNSRLRLERVLREDPLVAGGYLRREGYIYQRGEAQVQFLSAERQANVVGATASILLDVDEAHKVDRIKFEEEFLPMTAYHNAPVVLWGVAADGRDLLCEYRSFNQEREPSLNLQYPAALWAELRPEYAAHYDERRRKLGEDHPVIKTQYDLVDVDSVGGFLTPAQRAILLAGGHARLRAPEPCGRYVAVMDVGGEDAWDEEEDAWRGRPDARRDSTALVVFEVGEEVTYDYPHLRLVEVYWWTGPRLEAQQEAALALLDLWKPERVVVDGRGVGAQLASYLRRRYPRVTVYQASLGSASEDCYDFLARINCGTVRIFRDDGSVEYAELCRQLAWTDYQIRQHDLMNLVKRKSTQHIDMVKAMTYLGRAVVPVRRGDPIEPRRLTRPEPAYSAGGTF